MGYNKNDVLKVWKSNGTNKKWLPFPRRAISPWHQSILSLQLISPLFPDLSDQLASYSFPFPVLCSPVFNLNSFTWPPPGLFHHLLTNTLLELLEIVRLEEMTGIRRAHFQAKCCKCWLTGWKRKLRRGFWHPKVGQDVSGWQKEEAGEEKLEGILNSNSQHWP